MSEEPQYELVDRGDCWAAVRDGETVFATWDRGADPEKPGEWGLLAQMTRLVQERWGRVPQWVPTGNGWVAR